jgi:hypothetical protein
MIAGPALLQRLNSAKTELPKIKPLYKGINRPNRIILLNIIFKVGWKQTALASINPLHEAGHASPPPDDSPAES